MFRDLEIICEQYSFVGLTDDINEANFFSGIEPNYLDSVDLTDYLLINSPVVFNNKHEEIDKFQDSLKLYGSFDTVKLSLTNLLKPKLFDFFALDNNDSNGFIKYKILIYENENLIFQGILKPNDLRYNMPYELNEREIVETTIYSWDKEFRDYFSQGEMPDFSANPSFWVGFTFLGVTVEMAYLNSMLALMFGFDFDNEIVYDDGIDGGENLAKWRMARVPNLINPDIRYNDPTFWWLNGYDYIRDNLKLSPFDFFRKLCNSMGWIFYFKIIDNQLKFVVRNRATNEDFYGERVIDNNDVIGYNTEYKQYQQKVKTIKLPAFQIDGGSLILYPRLAFSEETNNKVKGSYDLIFSKESIAPRKDHIFVNEMKINFELGSNKIIPYPYNDYGFSKYIDSNEDNHKYVNMFYEYHSDEIVIIESHYFNYETKFLLEVDGGHNNFTVDKKRRKDLNTGTATDYRNGENVSERDFIYCGNIGTAMFREQASNQWTQYIAFSNVTPGNFSYTKSAQMKANMNKLLTDNSNLVLNISVKGFYPYIDEVISFTNPLDVFPYGYSYDIISANADYTNQVTNYSLQRRLD